MNTLQTTLQELQKKIKNLNAKKQTTLGQKAELEQKISSLYAQPLNDRQMMQLMLTVVDGRIALYKEDVSNTGFLEAQKTQNGRPLSFDDFEQIQGRGRVLGNRQTHSDKDLLFKFELVRTYGVNTHT